MVAYGVPVIHQSLATAPLDIKEAIDWLIRIGGKDMKGDGDDKCSELIQVLKATVMVDCRPSDKADYVNGLESILNTLFCHLFEFVGYHSNGGATTPCNISGSGIARRSGQCILKDIDSKGFLECCKGDSGTCTSMCKCCTDGTTANVNCDPRVCPINSILQCPIPMTGMCGENGDRPPNGSSVDCKLCCILSFLETCLVEGEELNNSSFKCKRCNGGHKLHGSCHKDCKCQHEQVISKVACRINCLIQLATTLNTVYIHRDVPMCTVCQNCKTCGRSCQPCRQCTIAQQSAGQHCGKCKRGECCAENEERSGKCQPQCQNCQTCSSFRNSKHFWLGLARLINCCAKCRVCNKQGTAEHFDDCSECDNCEQESCDVGCRNRKEFGKLVSELFYYMAYNFGDVAYALRGLISSTKDSCCNENTESTLCRCHTICCGTCKANGNICKDCKLYCICCVDRKDKGSCVCNNQCSEKLELLLRPALSGYISAYDYKKATWENLCTKANGDNKGKCSDQCTESCQCSSTDCPAEGCCTHCPKRKCAMIFCMVVPAIYRFFDYINHQIDAELGDGSVNPTSQWASALIDGDMQLGEFLRSCGYASKRLQSKIGCHLLDGNHNASNSSCLSTEHKPGNLHKLIESCGKVNKVIVKALHLFNHPSNVSEPYRKPTSIREKVLWLCGLPYSDVFDGLQNTLRKSMPHLHSSHSIMGLSLRMSAFTFHIFEDSSQSIWEYITQGFKLPGGSHYLYYTPDTIRLLWDIYDAVYAVTCAMVFMNKQCSVSSIKCGWEECKFGSNVETSTVDGNTCKCPSTCKGTCDHCTTNCNACQPGIRCVCCCPYCEQRPDNCLCLVRFITDNGSMTNEAVPSAFLNGRYGPMGFRQSGLRKVEMSGAALYNCMSGILMDDHALFSRLLECLMIARAGVPENLSDYYALFLGLGMRLQMESKEYVGNHKAFAVLFKRNMRDTFFGADDAIMESVVAAVHKLYKEESSHTSRAGATHNGSFHNASDLASLYGCYTGNACVGYMYSLSSGPYELLSRYPHAAVGESAGLFIKWVFCGATSLYNLMSHLRAEVNMLECCHKSSSCTCHSTNTSTCACKDCNCFCQHVSSGCFCGAIVMCKNIHPLLYQFGFTFHEPDMWSSQKRKCKDFSDALGRFLGPESMLRRLMEAIENFLWHIRMPFCIAFMTLWSTAFCFLMYVFIGHLDRLGIRSRWLSQKQLTHPLQFIMRTMVKPMGSGSVVI
ncbi:variant erythrocyte surface antigen [Babesia gibsoni]|uniref:Variant erythrocyte surface antigen n=1 Tax=Babesia gibsoni TaxID=33632 RepID=A0AAD8LGL6_BABGI|nr:variant erythrocyte surface antigen [Babesia gibsoni]